MPSQFLVSLVLLVIGLRCLAAEPVSLGGRQNREAKRMDKSGEVLEISVYADKAVYRLNDRLKLQTQLTNTSKKSLYVFAYLSWGYSASLTLHVSDSSGRGVQGKFFDDSITPPPPPGQGYDLVRLYPQHFLGTYYYSSIDELNLSKPGEYTLFVEYHSPISARDAHISPFWGKEDGKIRSNPVRIQVVK